MLFTIILEFDGVNSVSQITASDEQTAFRGWLDKLRLRHDLGLSTAQASELLEAFESDPGDEPTALDTICNVCVVPRLSEISMHL